jgi:XTP/dITP diphosphohydrolase
VTLGRRLVVASGNRHKIEELRAMLGAAVPDLAVVGLDPADDPPGIPETARDFAGNATLKARGIARWLRGRGEPPDTLVLADDSGICVEAFDGAPGVHSARWAGEPSDDAANNARLCEELGRRGLTHSAAHYACVLALVRVDERPIESDAAVWLFEGRWDVEVRTDRRGSGGFGYDPHAWLEGEDRTVAELASDEKAARSHRGRALRRLLAWAQAAGGRPAP